MLSDLEMQDKINTLKQASSSKRHYIAATELHLVSGYAYLFCQFHVTTTVNV